MTENVQNEIITQLVSIVIPFYNMEEFLGEAIESVLEQSVINWELLLIDDGSTDKSFEIAQSYAEKYPLKIHLLSHENNENKGPSASRNLGIERSKGSYITFLDADDIFFPDTLELELKAFAENPEADAVCGTFECWFSWSDEAKKWEKDFTADLVLEIGRLYQPPDLLVQNLISGGRKPQTNCMILKSEFAKTVGLFEEKHRYAWEDQVVWAKLSLNGKIYVMDAILAKYRQHPASTCAIESLNGEDIPSMSIYLDWLEIYLNKQNVKNKDVWKALHGFRRTLYFEIKLKKLKQIYRRQFPLHLRYKIRDKLTRSKQILSWTSQLFK